MSLKDNDLPLAESQKSHAIANNGSLALRVNRPQSSYPIDGKFGTGEIVYFLSSGTFKVPNGITTVRARVWGAGGGGDAGAGGTSSFGNFCSATGGEAGIWDTKTPGSGGQGDGGDINRNGGAGATTIITSNNSTGGGGVGNLYGNGNETSGQGGYGNQSGASGLLAAGGNAGESAPNYGVASITQLSIDAIGTGGGGGGRDINGYSSRSAGAGWNGGGGGRNYGHGGYPGGGAAATNTASGGGGFSLKTCNVSPGQSIAVTVGMATRSGARQGKGGNGLVIVEY